MRTLVLAGCGYVASRLLPYAHAAGWTTIGTHREQRNDNSLSPSYHQTCLFDGQQPVSPAVLAAMDALLVSIPPDADGDPWLRAHQDLLTQAPHLQWIGYISSTAVYGDHGGNWVDETTPITPQSSQGIARARAEAAWQTLTKASHCPLYIFRAAGIYGPSRNMLQRLSDGLALPHFKPGAFVSRIHVDDFVRAILAGLANPEAAGIYNIADDEPTPTATVAAFTASLLQKECTEESNNLEPAKNFTNLIENRRIANHALKKLLGGPLLFPSYREGLRALAASLPRNIDSSVSIS